MHATFVRKTLKERDHLEDLYLDGWIILNVSYLISMRECIPKLCGLE